MNSRFHLTEHHVAQPEKLTSGLTEFVASPDYALLREQAPTPEHFGGEGGGRCR